MRHILTAATAVVVLVLSGCGAEESAPGAATTSPSASGSASGSASASAGKDRSARPRPTEEESPEGTVVEVTIEDGRVDPAGERVRVAAGEPVTFQVDSDVAGEMHAHATPEQSIAFGPGTSEHTITIDRPGVVEVELHDPLLVVVQLQVG